MTLPSNYQDPANVHLTDQRTIDRVFHCKQKRGCLAASKSTAIQVWIDLFVCELEHSWANYHQIMHLVVGVYCCHGYDFSRCYCYLSLMFYSNFSDTWSGLPSDSSLVPRFVIDGVDYPRTPPLSEDLHFTFRYNNEKTKCLQEVWFWRDFFSLLLICRSYSLQRYVTEPTLSISTSRLRAVLLFLLSSALDLVQVCIWISFSRYSLRVVTVAGSYDWRQKHFNTL